MTTSRTTALALVVWGIGFACAAALVIAVRPPEIPARTPDTQTVPDPVLTVERAPTVIEIPTIVIVAQPSSRPRRPTPTGPVETRCGEWRALVQGRVDQRVRACEEVPRAPTRLPQRRPRPPTAATLRGCAT